MIYAQLPFKSFKDAVNIDLRFSVGFEMTEPWPAFFITIEALRYIFESFQKGRDKEIVYHMWNTRKGGFFLEGFLRLHFFNP